MPSHLFLYILSFVGIWLGAGLIISSIEKFSHRLRLSSFSISFLILGLFTSIGEISVGINSVIDNDPEIFVGNLIGASIVLFLLIIPLLAITGKQIKINPEFQKINLISSLVVIGLPVILCLDGRVDKIDGLISIALFAFSAFLIESKRGLLQNPKTILQKGNPKIILDLIKIVVGVVIVYFCSQSVVHQTEYFSHLLSISPFLISLVLVSLGTNMPEISLVIKSLFVKDKEIAFGDYVGSAAYNTAIFGALALWYGKTINLTNSYAVSILVLLVGLFLFYIFAKSKNTLSRKEGLYLLCLYSVFIFIEVYIHLKFSC